MHIGLTSALGAIGHWRAGNVSWRPALTFGLMAMIGAFAGGLIRTAYGVGVAVCWLGHLAFKRMKPAFADVI